MEISYITEEELANQALDSLHPSVRGFYSAQYQIIPDTGKFQGLSCKVCNRWQEFGHDKNCPVKKLEDDLVKIDKNE